MPTYEYACSACGHQWEAEQRIVEPPLETCPTCNQKTAHRLISAANFILKGGGWYADLYSKPTKKAVDKSQSDSTSATPSSSSSSSPATKSEPAKSESKPPAAVSTSPTAT